MTSVTTPIAIFSLTLRTYTQQPVIASMRLNNLHNKPDNVFEGVPISQSDCSRYLRLAAVQNVIYKVINNFLWKPWFCGYLRKEINKDQEVVQKMFECLQDRGENERHNWKVSTLRILERLDDKVDMAEVVEVPVGQVVKLLKPLLDDDQRQSLETELIDTLIEAVELGKKSRSEKVPVLISMNPKENDSKAWKEYLSHEYESYRLADSSSGSPVEPVHQQLLVSPLVFREVTGQTGSMARQKMSNDKRDGRTEIEVVYPGMAIFSEIGILQDGAAESKLINNAGAEVSKHGNARRASSVLSSPLSPTTGRRHGNASTSGLASQPPSKTWGSGTGPGLGIATETTDMYG